MSAAEALSPPGTEATPAWAVTLLVDVAVIKTTTTSSAVAVQDHETRLRALERRAWALSGAAALTGAGISQLVTILGGPR